jgi:hypothetical protein
MYLREREDVLQVAHPVLTLDEPIRMTVMVKTVSMAVSHDASQLLFNFLAIITHMYSIHHRRRDT